MPESTSTILHPGRIAERYDLLRRLGETDAIQTWEALDRRLDRPVLVRLAAEPVAHERIRELAHQLTLRGAPGAPRVLDGGEDPTYGPFVVAELNEPSQATQPLDVAALPVHEPANEADGGPSRLGLLVLLGLLLAIGLAAAFVVRTFVLPPAEPVALPTAVAAVTPVPPLRPLSGAQAGQTPAPTPTLVPTLAPAPAAARPQPTVQPTAPATAVPTSPPTPQPTARPTPRPTAQPIPPRAAAAAQPASGPAVASGSPADTIRQHYALINAGDNVNGYQLMDTHLQSLNTPAAFASWFANKVSVQPLSIDVVSQTSTRAVVRAVVLSTDRVNGQNVTSQVTEQFVLVPESGAWRIDQVTPL